VRTRRYSASALVAHSVQVWWHSKMWLVAEVRCHNRGCKFFNARGLHAGTQGVVTLNTASK
jgi:hypothetical protein